MAPPMAKLTMLLFVRFHFFYQYARAREIVVTKSPTHKVNGCQSQELACTKDYTVSR